MRKIIFQMMVSLDGFFEGPEHELDWHAVDDEFNEYASDLLDTIDTLIFGRVTYEGMASYWPSDFAIKNDPIIAAKMNRLKKIVFSTTLNKTDWANTRLVKGDPALEISGLKPLTGKDMAIFGSSDLALSLIPANLIDEYRIFMNPVILGEGKTIFKGIRKRLNLKLVKSRVFKSGLVCLYYQPV
jgi:dihydrofolate reductase